MAEAEPTKMCPLCAETIKAKAKVCPYCRKIQHRGFFINRYDLLAVGTVIAFCISCGLVFNVFIHGRDFSSSRDKVKVLKSSLSLAVTPDYTNVVVDGMLTNGSSYSWKLGRMDVRFSNASGQIIDADHSSFGHIVLPHNDRSFHLTLYSRNSIPTHASYEVVVESATESGYWGNDD